MIASYFSLGVFVSSANALMLGVDPSGGTLMKEMQPNKVLLSSGALET